MLSIICMFVLVFVIGASLFVIDYLTTISSVRRLRSFKNDPKLKMKIPTIDDQDQLIYLQDKILIDDYTKQLDKPWIVQAYIQLVAKYKHKYLQKVKSDDYSHFRNIFVQMIIGNLHLTRRWKDKRDMLEEVEYWHARHAKFYGWNLILPQIVSRENELWAMKEILAILWSLFDNASMHSSFQGREKWISLYLNKNPIIDIVAVNGIIILTDMEILTSGQTQTFENANQDKVLIEHLYLKMIGQALGVKINMYYIDKETHFFSLIKNNIDLPNLPEITLFSDISEKTFDTMIVKDSSQHFNCSAARISSLDFLLTEFKDNPQICLKSALDDKDVKCFPLQEKIPLKDYIKGIPIDKAGPFIKILEDYPSFCFVYIPLEDGVVYIRAIIIQMMISGIGLTKRWKSLAELIEQLRYCFTKGTLLSSYKFDHCDFVTAKADKLWVMEQILKILWAALSEAQTYNSNVERENWLLECFNSYSFLDPILMEATMILCHLEMAINNYTVFDKESTGKKDFEYVAISLGIGIPYFLLNARKNSYELITILNDKDDFPLVSIVCDDYDSIVILSTKDSILFIP